MTNATSSSPAADQVEPEDRTEWTRTLGGPLRAFLSTESGSAGVLLVAIVAAIVWATLGPGAYELVWTTDLSIRLGSTGVTLELREWVNSGLMTFFFLVVGLEARREFDLGDLRERRRAVLPFTAGVAGLAVPIVIYLAITHGGQGSHAWGVAMSTDTALALGVISLMGRHVPGRVRVFLLTVFVVDDLLSLVVIAVVYSSNLKLVPILIAIVLFVLMLLLPRLGVRAGAVYALLAVIMWVTLLESGVDPVVTGLVIGLMVTAYSPARDDLEQATGLFRLFREQPTPELARTASAGLRNSLSANDRLQAMYHPWTSYLIVPLFGLANAGIPLSWSFLADAYTTPITLGVIVAYVVGKPIGVVGASWILTRCTRGRLRPDVGWAAVTGSGTIAGIGFTVSFLIASLALGGELLADVKVGVLTAAVVASLITVSVYRLTALLPPARKARALLGDADQILDLVPPVDPDRDHVRGPADATVTLVEYGDFECPFCGQAEPVVRDLLSDTDLRYVWRHLPLPDVHPAAPLAAEASEAAAAQGAFWPMRDLLITHQDRLRLPDLLSYAADLGLDGDRFRGDLKGHTFKGRVAADVGAADQSGVSGTPTFFINGRRHYGAYDEATLAAAIRAARARALADELPPRSRSRAGTS